MNKSWKNWVVAGAVVAAVGLGGTYYAFSSAHADTSTNPVSTFMAKLAGKLGVSTDSLQTAVDETKTEVKSEELTTAVTSGSLTQEQADLLSKIEAYHETERSTETDAERQAERDAHQAVMDSMTGATVAERQAAMEQFRAQEDQAMATALGVDLATLQSTLDAARTAHVGGPGMGEGMGEGGMEGGRGMGGGRGMMKGGFGI